MLDIVKSKQAVLTVSNFFIAATFFAIPWCRNVEFLMGFMVVNGLSLGVIETGMLILQNIRMEHKSIFKEYINYLSINCV